MLAPLEKLSAGKLGVIMPLYNFFGKDHDKKSGRAFMEETNANVDIGRKQ